jgi:hypothetical protein
LRCCPVDDATTSGPASCSVWCGRLLPSSRRPTPRSALTPGGRPLQVQGVCACTAGRVCAPPSATSSVERCRLRRCDHVGDRHHPVLPLVVEAPSAAGRNQHSPRPGSSGDRALHTLGEGEAWGRDLASTLRGCCQAWGLGPCLLGGGAYPPRRAGIASQARRIALPRQ